MTQTTRREQLRISLRDTFGGPVAEGVDQLFVSMAFKNPRVGRRATRPSVVSRVSSAADLYPSADAEGRLFPEPGLPPYATLRKRALKGGRVEDLSWDSAYRALDTSHARTLARVPQNARCRARVFRHDGPAPTVICLHGWGVGYLSVEEHTFEAARLYRAGLNVVLFAMPFHGRRSPWGRATPMFPTVDPVRTNEGFAQGIFDLRALIRILRKEGVQTLGVLGMSLGAFTTSLLVTVEPGIDFAVPIIGFGSVAELLWDHIDDSPMKAISQERGIDRALYARSLSATTPLCRVPLIVGERVLVIAGERDGVTPLRHSLALREHFPGSSFATFPGGHVVQVGRQRAFQALITFLGRLGML